MSAYHGRAYDPMEQLSSEQSNKTLLAFLAEGSGIDADTILHLIAALAADGGMDEAFYELVKRGSGESRPPEAPGEHRGSKR